MTLKPGAGTAMRMHKIPVRFEAVGKPGAKQDSQLHDRVALVRKLLRTNKTPQEIADELNVCLTSLRGFIKRRNLCNLSDRAHFISLQKSLEKV